MKEYFANKVPVGLRTMTLDWFLKRGKKITLHCLWHWENGRLVRLIQTSKPNQILRAGNQQRWSWI